MNGEYERLIERTGNICSLFEKEEYRLCVEFLRAAYDMCYDVVMSHDGRTRPQEDCHASYGVVPATLFIALDGYMLGAISTFACAPMTVQRNWKWVVIAISGRFICLTYEEFKHKIAH